MTLHQGCLAFSVPDLGSNSALCRLRSEFANSEYADHFLWPPIPKLHVHPDWNLTFANCPFFSPLLHGLLGSTCL
ncbi:hypothetical protein DUNSADRAFT_8724 [Dunaliella salina]|uniref:Encoded protein n=1 Tax=Dunaliella salina TaxID=3046 RepID=A0ABQ7GIX1_DUNSA|nr:hypothetical protein DUNSADRAFT_8724 [Dunaliella salina]|eukprot:KAF5834557.1 hypothetical protein DUNSADRAFT_8724 [Dunaliella salina]